MSATTSQPEAMAPGGSILDRSLNLAAVTWETVAWIVVLVVALALRLVQLDGWALAPDEASHAYNAWLLVRGEPAPAGDLLPETGPLLLIAQAMTFFLFGATDVIARLVPAAAGVGLVALPLALRPVIGRPAALGMAGLAAISPTLVYASRVATPGIVVALLAIALVVIVIRAGAPVTAAIQARRHAVLAGIVLGAMLGAGAAALTVLATMLIGAGLTILLNPEGAARRGLVALARTPGSMLSLAGGFVATVLVLFTRFFTDPLAIAGAGQTLADWWRLLFQGPAAVPVQFFLMEVLLYEPLAALMSLLAALGLALPGVRRFGGAFFGGWFVASLLLWSFSAGRGSEDAAFVALPLVLLGGAALGKALARVDWRHVRAGAGGALALVILGLLLSLAAVDILLTDPAPNVSGVAASLPAVVVVMLVTVPLAYAAWMLARSERAAGRGAQTGLILLLVAAALLGGFTLRSAVMLTLFRGDTGTELLAQRTSSGAVLPTVQRLDRLARDATVTDASARDATGGHGLVIAAEEPVQWPFRWYFRDYPDFSVVPAGAVGTTGADVVIGQDGDALEAAGYRPLEVAWVSQVPAAYANPDAGAVLRDLVWPPRWLAASRFLLYREGLVEPGYEMVAIGLNAELAARIAPSNGPYSLTDRAGPGAADGQFNQPVGVAAADGTIYVVDQGNSRIELFTADGAFLDVWGDGTTDLELARTPNGLGPTGISVDEAGTIYVADTWNHRVVALDQNGSVALELGGAPDAAGFRVAADTTDDPALVTSQTGSFFGPRDVVAYDDEIYVVDTGNERIQVFGADGEFRRLWGGYGTGPGQLIEPVGIAVDGAGIIHVADSGNARISRFTAAGEPVAPWPVAAWPAPDPSGMRPAFQPYLTFGRTGDLYVTAADTGSVEVLDADGQQVESITSVNGERLQRPTGIGTAPNGEILITDTLANAVFRYTPLVLPPRSDIQLGPPGSDAIIATPIAGDDVAPNVDAAPTARAAPAPPGLGP
ncbi:MAG: 6-bladed beta-propeller [Chloroflexota bacterium]|nr:6-bladed beta-propeller [Chloroflexota bacterium]